MDLNICADFFLDSLQQGTMYTLSVLVAVSWCQISNDTLHNNGAHHNVETNTPSFVVFLSI